MEINGSQATFDLSIIGNKTNESYMGTFKAKCLLSPLEEIEADRLYREIIGQNAHLATEHVRRLAFALAQLDQRLVEFPPFWENDRLGGGHIEDDNIILEVLDRAIEAQEKFIEGKKKELEERQKRLTQMIKKKQIEKEPEVEQVGDEAEPEEVEID